MTRQERIQQVADLVALNIRGTATDEEREKIINNVEYLGEMWKQAEAHIKALCICVGAMKYPEEKYDLNNEDHLKFLEKEGSDTIVQYMGLPGYVALVNNPALR